MCLLEKSNAGEQDTNLISPFMVKFLSSFWAAAVCLQVV